MLKLRQNYLDSQTQLSEIKVKVSELEAELATTKRVLVTAQSDCMGPDWSFHSFRVTLLTRNE